MPGRPVVRGTEVMASISRKRSQKSLRASDKKASDKKPTKRGKGTKGAKSGANKKSQTARRKNQSPRMVEWDPGGVIAGASGQIVHGKY